MLIKKFVLSVMGIFVFVGTQNAFAVARTTTQSAIQQGTTVRTKIEAVGLYDQACYDAYFGCMDQFCIIDNANGGACGCSDDSIEYEQEFAANQEILDEATRFRT